MGDWKRSRENAYAGLRLVAEHGVERLGFVVFDLYLNVRDIE